MGSSESKAWSMVEEKRKEKEKEMEKKMVWGNSILGTSDLSLEQYRDNLIEFDDDDCVVIGDEKMYCGCLSLRKLKVKASEFPEIVGKYVVVKTVEKNSGHAVGEMNIFQLMRIKSPYLVKYFCYYVESNKLNIIMEFCDDGDLESYLSNGKPFEKKDVEIMIAQLTTGMFVLHGGKEEFLHGSLKIENIFVLKGNLKIGDFGTVAIKARMNALATGIYARFAPELRGKGGSMQVFTDWSDVFALGRVFRTIISNTSEDCDLGELKRITESMLSKAPEDRPHVCKKSTKVVCLIDEPFIIGGIRKLPRESLPKGLCLEDEG